MDDFFEVDFTQPLDDLHFTSLASFSAANQQKQQQQQQQQQSMPSASSSSLNSLNRLVTANNNKIISTTATNNVGQIAAAQQAVNARKPIKTATTITQQPIYIIGNIHPQQQPSYIYPTTPIAATATAVATATNQQQQNLLINKQQHQINRTADFVIPNQTPQKSKFVVNEHSINLIKEKIRQMGEGPFTPEQQRKYDQLKVFLAKCIQIFNTGQDHFGILTSHQQQQKQMQPPKMQSLQPSAPVNVVQQQQQSHGQQQTSQLKFSSVTISSNNNTNNYQQQQSQMRQQYLRHYSTIPVQYPQFPHEYPEKTNQFIITNSNWTQSTWQLTQNNSNSKQTAASSNSSTNVNSSAVQETTKKRPKSENEKVSNKQTAKKNNSKKFKPSMPTEAESRATASADSDPNEREEIKFQEDLKKAIDLSLESIKTIESKFKPSMSTEEEARAITSTDSDPTEREEIKFQEDLKKVIELSLESTNTKNITGSSITTNSLASAFSTASSDLPDNNDEICVEKHLSMPTSGKFCEHCEIKEISVRLFPCKHDLYCEECAASFKRCLSCKKLIEKRVDLNTGVEIKDTLSKLKEIEEEKTCAICLEKAKDTAFDCGHQSCSECAPSLKICPVCRKPIKNRIKLFS